MEFNRTRLAGIVTLATTAAYALYRLRSAGAETEPDPTDGPELDAATPSK